MAQPCELNAVEARKLIGERRLSPVALLESCIERIESANPAVNAVVTKAYGRARSEAKEAEAAVARGGPLGLLHGLPIVIKDLNDTEAIRTTYCSPLFKSHIPTSDDLVVARIRREGGIILGKTNSPEFGTGSNTTNRVFGSTANPFNTTLTCGGSSGGSGVAVATGMAALANGSDSAASIRNPAAFCGVVGLRPSPGLVATDRRAMGLSNNGVEGPLGRHVADVALFLSAMAEYDCRDILSRPIEPSIFRSLRHVNVTALRVATSEDLGFAPVDEVVRETFRTKLSAISPAFGICDHYDVDMQGAEEAYRGVRGMHLLAGQNKNYKEHRDELDANLKWNLDDAMKDTPADVAFALAEQTRLYQKFQKVFDNYDILITPAVNVLPFPHTQSYPTTVEGRSARHYLEWCSILYGISLVGHPAISIPAGLGPDGMPFGLQVVGCRFGDHRLLEIAQALESLLAGTEETSRPKPDIEALSAKPPLKERTVVD